MDWLKIEHVTDTLIPFALVLLVGMLVTEFVNPTLAENIVVEILDALIVALFVVDLCFKFYHAKTIPYFLKHYWLEIIAVFPFFLVFRLLDGLGLLTFTAGEAAVREGQGLVHAGSEIQKEAVAVTRTLTTAEREAELAAKTASAIEKDAVVVTKLTRAQRLVRFIKPLFDSRKVGHAATFYDHPKDRAARIK